MEEALHGVRPIFPEIPAKPHEHALLHRQLPIPPLHEGRGGCDEDEASNLSWKSGGPFQRDLPSQGPADQIDLERMRRGKRPHPVLRIRTFSVAGKIGAMDVEISGKALLHSGPAGRIHSPSVQKYEVSHFSAQTRSPISSSPWAAESEILSLAVPAGTVGCLIAGIRIPLSRRRALRSSAAWFSPTT